MGKQINHQQLKQQTRDAYDWLAPTYAAKWISQLDKQIIEHFLDMVAHNSFLLDIGCGPGHYARFFSENGLNVVGIDLSQGMLMEACQHWRNDHLAQMDMWNLGFPPDTFDALWVCASFDHVPESQALRVLQEFRRVLKDKGILFIGAVSSPNSVRIETAEEMGDYKQQGRFFQWYRNSEHFETYLKEAGFDVLDTISRVIHSNVLEYATCRINVWTNFYCRLHKI